ncbi:hypothetical protein KAU45_05605 [bacterium]|nr:hypothetical protein [bacterium]
MKLKLKIGLLAFALAVLVAGLVAVGSSGVTARSLIELEPDGNFRVMTFTHNIGNFGNVVFNTNNVGAGDVIPNAEWPLGSGNEYGYTGSLWFGNQETVIHTYFAMQELEWQPKSPIYNTDPGTPYPLPSSFGIHEGTDYSWMSQYWRTNVPSRVSDQDGHWYTTDEGSDIPIGLEVVAQSLGWSAPGHDEWLTIIYFLHYVGAAPLDSDTFIAFAYDIDCGGSLSFDNDLAQFDGNSPSLGPPEEPFGAGDGYNNVTWAPGGDGIPDEYDSVNFPMPIDGSADTQPYWGHFDCSDYDPFEAAPRKMSYMFDSEWDSGGPYPGFVGVRFLRACIDPGGDNEREYIVTGQHSWDIMNDPENDSYKFAYMVDTGTYEEITTAYDWRICPSVGPFESMLGIGMEPDEVLEIRKCFVIGYHRNGMRKNADQALTDALGFNGRFDDPRQGDDVDDFVVLSPPKSPLLSAIVGETIIGDRRVSIVTLHWSPVINLTDNVETLPDISSNDQIDFEGYRLYRAPTLDQLGDSADMAPWYSDSGFDEPVYLRNLLYSWDKDINDTSHWTDGGEYWKAPGYDGPGAPTDPDLRAQRYEYNQLNNWDDIKRDPTNDKIYEYIDDGTNYDHWDKWVDYSDFGGDDTWADDYDAPGPLAPRNHFTYFYAVVSFDFGAHPFYNEQIGSDPYPALEGGVRANYVEVTLSTANRDSLDDVLVVPNPYIGGVDWQTRSVTGIVERKLAFTNLPERCTIRIYTISGDLVDIIEHNNQTSGTAWWDLQSRNNMEVASGVYIYHIDATELGLGTKIGKLAIIMGERL